MINIIADTHTHTLACDHAYSTLQENVNAAVKAGLDAIALTEHSPSVPGAPSWLHFSCLPELPDYLDGIRIIKGIEVNIMDYDGTLDLHERLLGRLEWNIASYHMTNVQPASKADHTRGWIKVAESPLVDVIGHCGDERYAFDHESVLQAVKEYGKIVEINSHSFRARPGSDENCRKIAARCARLGIPVVVSSDAHHASRIGDVAKSLAVLESMDFPEELILNADKERFYNAVAARRAFRK